MIGFSAKEVSEMAGHAKKAGIPKTAAMLRELASRLRQEEEEAKRDPVTDPRPGDRMQSGPFSYIWIGDAKNDVTGKLWMWKTWASEMSNTIIRRREVQQ